MRCHKERRRRDNIKEALIEQMCLFCSGGDVKTPVHKALRRFLKFLYGGSAPKPPREHPDARGPGNSIYSIGKLGIWGMLRHRHWG